MYKITLHFQSNEKEIYTTEIEIATEDFFKFLKYDRMLDRWFDILCPHINFNRFFFNMQCKMKALPAPYIISGLPQQQLEREWKLILIQEYLKQVNELNKEKIESGEENARTFEIKVEEI